MSFEELAQGYLDSRRVRLAPSSLPLERGALDRLQQFAADLGLTDPREFQPHHLRLLTLWLESLPGKCGHRLAVSTVARVLLTVRQLFRWAHRQGRLLFDPAAELVIPATRGSSRRLFPTREQVTRLLAAPDPSKPWEARDRVVLELAYGLGLRRCELHQLNVEDVGLTAQELRIRCGKGSRGRILPLSDRLAELLEGYLQGSRPQLLPSCGEPALWVSSDRLWTRPGPDGTRLGASRLSGLPALYARRAGLPSYGLHSLRHAFATHLLESGAPVQAIRRLLGHEHIDNTATYTHVSSEALKELLSERHPRGRNRKP